MIAFTGIRLDRADHLRADPSALMGIGARLLRLDGLEPAAGDALVWGSLAEARDGAELVFLGLLDGSARFAQVPPAAPGSMAPPSPALWAAMAGFTADDLALYGMARALLSWHARHPFCAQCGAPTVLAKGGWQRTCTGCRAEHFPRVDPVVIMLVEHADGRLLLGRQPRYPAGRYSALAGFVEPGETIEEAVTREVREEAGLAVRDVAYVASQPWPFPGSLMFGCHAMTDDNAIVIDTTELDDARWFTRAEVAAAMAGDGSGQGEPAFLPPPKTAIAHTLLDWWLSSGQS